jgi:L-alanine-DL-glutamate epimerase-like enolase superfamily enzyme
MSEFTPGTGGGQMVSEDRRTDSIMTLTIKSVDVRAVCVPLRRPVVSKVGLFKEWPLILIDLHTEQGVTGRSYLEPYLKNAAKAVVPLIRDLVAARTGQPIAPLADFQPNRKSLNLLGYEGIAMIAVAGLDMAMWDALGKAAGLPLATLLGGSTGAVPAYNSNGLPCARRRGAVLVRGADRLRQPARLRPTGSRVAHACAAWRELPRPT